MPEAAAKAAPEAAALKVPNYKYFAGHFHVLPFLRLSLPPWAS